MFWNFGEFLTSSFFSLGTWPNCYQYWCFKKHRDQSRWEVRRLSNMACLNVIQSFNLCNKDLWTCERCDAMRCLWLTVWTCLNNDGKVRDSRDFPKFPKISRDSRSQALDSLEPFGRILISSHTLLAWTQWMCWIRHFFDTTRMKSCGFSPKNTLLGMM
jgi:hypothetical protein